MIDSTDFAPRARSIIEEKNARKAMWFVAGALLFAGVVAAICFVLLNGYITHGPFGNFIESGIKSQLDSAPITPSTSR